MAGKVVDVTLKLIDQLSNPLSSINSSLKNSANQWTKSGKQMQNAGKAISGVGTTLTASLTAPIVAGGTACVKLASDFEAGMSGVASICGATGDELDALSEKAKEMGAKTKYSATEATDAFKYMAMAGWTSSEMMSGIEGIMYLAGATGEDLAQTSDIVTDSLTAFGLTASDTSMYVDVLAQTANKSNTDVSLLGESFKYVAPVAGALGYSVQDVSVALGLMANNGIKASSAGTTLRSWLSNMSAPTDAVSNAMKKLGLSLTDSKGNMKSFSQIMTETRSAMSGLSESEKTMYAKTLAGKSGMSGLLAIVNASDSDFNSLTEGINNANGACEEMYNIANDNLEGQLTILKSTLESLAISFGEILVPYLKKGAEYAQNLLDKFNGLSDGTKEMIVKVLLIVASVGPAVLIFGKMITTVGRVVSMVGKFGKAVKSAGSIMALVTSPAGIVIAVLAGIVVATVLVIKNWDKIKATAQKVFGYVKSIFSSLGISADSIKEKLSPIGEKFSAIGARVKKVWVTIKPVLTKIGDIFKLVFTTILGGAIGGAIAQFKVLFDGVTMIINAVLVIFDGLLTYLSGVFTGDWNKIWDGIKEIFSGVFQALVGLCKTPLNAVIALINGAIAGINGLGLTIPDWVPGIGGKSFSIDIPTIPTLGVGTDNWKGGIVQISERGGEIVDLPSGSRVYPHDESVNKAYADGSRSGSVTLNIPKLADQIIVRQDSDIDAIAQKLADKLEKISLNMGGADIGYIY